MNVNNRRAFTLVELLVVCTIIVVLAGMVLFALQGANETARIDRTQSQVRKINDLVTPRMSAYRERPLPMSPQLLMTLEGKTAAQQRIMQNVAEARLRITWELMRMELPERKADLREPAAVLKTPSGTPLQPSLWLAYRRKAEALTGATWGGSPSVETRWTDDYSNAECLYLILSTIREGDTNGLDFFQQSEIGDTDGDGMPEILDGWKRPIRWLRWAPGYSSGNGLPTKMQTGNATAQPDPFDPLKIYPAHFALFPLVYSAGPDGLYGIEGGSVNYAAVTPRNDPWYSVTTAPIIGGPAVDGGKSNTHLDNLTNHFNVAD